MRTSPAGSAGEQSERAGDDAPSLALVHDYLLVLRGAERAFAEVAACWPDAPLYTLLYSEQGTHGAFRDRAITTSRLQHTRASQKGFRRLLPFYASAARSLPLDGHRVVVSSTTAFAHLISTPPGAVHISYCHSPFRYAWHDQARALTEMPRLARPALRAVLWRHRRQDLRAARQVTHFIAGSRIAQERILEYWGRSSSIVHPPVATERFRVGEPQDYFLVVGELVLHKRVDLALEAARRAGVPLKVVGDGPELARLMAHYRRPGIEFLGRVSDERLVDLYAGARAFVLPNVEEFGISAVEAQAAGRPVVAAAAGGALETVIDGVTGVHVAVDDADALAAAMRDVDFDAFDVQALQANAERFSPAVFRQRFPAAVERVVREQLGPDAADALMPAPPPALQSLPAA